MPEPEIDLNDPPMPPERAGAGPLRWTLRIVGGLLLAVVLAVGGFVAYLQTDHGRRFAAEQIVQRANPYEDATLSIGRITGNWVTTVGLRDLVLVRRDGSTMLRVDTLRADYRLLPIVFGRKLHITDGFVSGLYVSMRQGPDRVFDVQMPFLPDTLAVADDSLKRRGLELQFDHLTVRRSGADFQFYNPRRDSVFSLRDFNGTTNGFSLTDRVAVTLDSLRTDYVLPTDMGRGRLATRGFALDDNLLSMDVLRLTSTGPGGAPGSDLTARGRLRLPADSTETLRDVDFTLRAAPFALSDVKLFAPVVNEEATVRLDGTVKGSLDRLAVDLTGETGDGATLAVRGALRPSTRDSVFADLTAEVRELDYGYFTTPTGNRVSADARAAVRGPSLETISGPVNVVLRGGRIGPNDLPRATLDAVFDAGVADLALATSYRGADLRAAGMLAPFEEPLRYNLTGRFQNVNLARFSPGAQTSNLAGVLRVQGQGVTLDSMDARATLDLAPSRVGPYRLTAGNVAATVRPGGRVDLGARLATPEGRLQLAGDARVPAGGDLAGLTYRISQGRIENFDVAAFAGQSVRSNVNATFSGSGRGVDPKTMTLDARAVVGPSVYGEYRLASGTLDARLRRGALDADLDVQRAVLPQLTVASARVTARTPSLGGPIAFTADARTDAGRLDLAGTAALTGGQQRVTLTRGAFQNLDLGRLANNDSLSTNLTGTLTGTVNGFAPATMTADLALRLAGSRVNEQTIENATARVRLARGNLAFDARAQTPGGGATLVGRARPFDAVPTFAVTRGELRNVDVAAFTGNPEQASDLNGRFTLSGRGRDLRTMDLDVRLDLDESRYGTYRLASADGTVRLRGGLATFDVNADTGEGTARLAGSVRPFDASPDGFAIALDEGRLVDFNLGPLVGNDSLQTSLNGTFSANLRGRTLQTMTGTVRAALDRSTVNNVVIESGLADVTLDRGHVVASLDATTTGGRLTLAASGRFFDEVPTYAVRGALEDVSVGALLGRDSLDAGGSLRFDLAGAGKDPRTMQLAGTVEADSGRYQTIRLDTLFARFDYARGLLDLDTLVARSNVANANAGGRAALFDTTSASDLRAAVELVDLLPVRRLMANDTLILAAEDGRLDARLYGPAGVLRYEATGALRQLVYNDLRVAGVDVRSAGTVDRTDGFAVRSAEGVATLDYLAKGDRITVRRSELTARYDTTDLVFAATVNADTRREAALNGRIDLRPEVRRVDFENLTLRFDTDRWQLVQPASVSYGDGLTVRQFLLASGGQQVAIDGRIDPRGEQDFVATLESFRIGAIADVFGFRGLDGALSGQIDLTGPAEAPRLAGELRSDVRSYDEHVGDLAVRLDYADRRLNTDALFTHRDGSTLRVDGFVPLDLTLAPTEDTGAGEGVALRADADNLAANERADLHVVADRFTLDWLRPFLDPATVRRLEGRLVADARIQGQLRDPDLSGDVRLAGGLVELPTLGVTYDSVAVDLELANDQIQVQSLRARSGGTLLGAGVVNFPDLRLGEFDLNLTLDGFQPIANDLVRLRNVSGPLRVQGTTARPQVSGDLRLAESELVLSETKGFDDVPLTREDVMTAEQRFGIRVGRDSTVSQTFQNLGLDLRVALGRDTWFRSRVTPTMDIQLDGNVEVRKRSGGELGLIGEVNVNPNRSRIETLGRRFNVSQGRLLFNGPLQELLVDVAATYEARRPGTRETAAQITLAADGRPLVPGDLTLSFTSDPPMETADILSYIATGRPADQSFAFGSAGGAGEGLVETGAGLALGQLAGLLEGVAGRELGLDVIDIEQDGINGTRLTAGKYLSPRLYASISQPIVYGTNATGALRGQQNTLVTLEYEVNDWLLANLVRDGPVIRVNLRWEYSY